MQISVCMSMKSFRGKECTGSYHPAQCRRIGRLGRIPHRAVPAAASYHCRVRDDLSLQGIWLKATASEAHISSRYLIQLHRPRFMQGTLPAEKSWLTWEGERMMFSNLKEKAEGTDRMARFVNCSWRTYRSAYQEGRFF